MEREPASHIETAFESHFGLRYGQVHGYFEVLRRFWLFFFLFLFRVNKLRFFLVIGEIFLVLARSEDLSKVCISDIGFDNFDRFFLDLGDFAFEEFGEVKQLGLLRFKSLFLNYLSRFKKELLEVLLQV